jgi:hypothetical protein
MSRHRRDHASHDLAMIVRGLAIGLALLALAGVSITHAAVASAQETATECVAPEPPPGTPTPMEERTPEAMAEMEHEVEEATPVAGTPADEATAAQVQAAVQNYAACYNTGDPTKWVPLLTENYLVATYGSANPYDAIAQEEGFPHPAAELVSIGNAMTYDDGRVSADVEAILGEHWFVHSRLFFVEDEGYWKLDQEDFLKPEPEGDTVVVGVNFVEVVDEATGETTYAFEPNVATITQQPVIILRAISPEANQEMHEMAVIQLPEGAEPTGLLDGTVPFEDVRFIGVVFDIPPGGQQDLALVNLEPGTYWLVCFFPSPDGTPHIARGMVTQITVVAPAE